VVLNTKYVQMLIQRPVRLGVSPQLLSTEHDRRLTAGVVNCCKLSAMRHSGPVFDSHRSADDAKVERTGDGPASFRSVKFWLTLR